MRIVFETPESVAKWNARKDKIYNTLETYSTTENQLIIPEPADPSSLSSIKFGAENALLTDRIIIVDTPDIVKRVVKATGMAVEAMAYGDQSMLQKNRKAENMWRTIFEKAARNPFMRHDNIRTMRVMCQNEIVRQSEAVEAKGYASRLDTYKRASRMNLFMESVFDAYYINGLGDDAYASKRKSQLNKNTRQIIN